MANNLLVAPDWGVIVGYVEKGKEFQCRTYWDKTEAYSTARNWPWGVLVIGETGGGPDRREAIMRSLEAAVELANTEQFGEYASGFAAYTKWIGDLLDDSKFEKLEEERRKRMACCQSWCYYSLADARRAASRYVRSIGGEFEGESAARLSRAGELYEEILEKLEEGREDAEKPNQGESWTRKLREAQAGILRETLAMERQAVDELKAALVAAGREL